jgi:hypothetical protein
MSRNPKKPTKSKRLKLALTERDKWKQILKEVEKAEAPVSVLHAITVNLIDGTSVDINIQDLLSEGVEPAYLEEEISRKLKELDGIVEDVDFLISIEHVAKAIQPATDSLLKNL